MKTTLEISDSTLRKAKSLAASRGVTLKQLFNEALEEKLRRAETNQGIEAPWMRLAGAFGRTAAARAESRRIQRTIDQEFETIDPDERSSIGLDWPKLLNQNCS